MQALSKPDVLERLKKLKSAYAEKNDARMVDLLQSFLGKHVPLVTLAETKLVDKVKALKQACGPKSVVFDAATKMLADLKANAKGLPATPTSTPISGTPAPDAKAVTPRTFHDIVAKQENAGRDEPGAAATPHTEPTIHSPEPTGAAPASGALKGEVKAESAPGGGAAVKAEGAPSTPVPSDGGNVTLESGDPKRDRARKLLRDALETRRNAERFDMDPTSLAVGIEKGLWSHFGGITQGYTDQLRSLKFNICDPNNNEFPAKILTGMIDPHKCATLSSDAMASAKKYAEQAKAIEDSCYAASSWDLTKLMSMTDTFTCGKCGQKKCCYYQKQTRSADEPMTTFVTCVPCGNRWRFC